MKKPHFIGTQYSQDVHYFEKKIVVGASQTNKQTSKQTNKQKQKQKKQKRAVLYYLAWPAMRVIDI